MASLVGAAAAAVPSAGTSCGWAPGWARVLWLLLDAWRARRLAATCCATMRRACRRAARASGASWPSASASCCASASSRPGRPRTGCRSSWPRSRPRPTAWCCSTSRAASNGATRRRPAQFGIDAERDLLQHLAQPGARSGLRGLPRLVELQPRRGDRRAVARQAHRGHPVAAVGAGASLCRQPPHAAHARHHLAGAGRGHAARFRRQRLARDPHAAHGAGRLRRDLAEPAARCRGAGALSGADGRSSRTAWRRWSTTC